MHAHDVILQNAQLELIEKLMRLDPPLHLFGGFAEEALLHGTVTRPHDDVDVLVWRDDLDLRRVQVRALGLTSVENRFDPIPGRPLVVVATDGRTELELCVADRSDNGAYFDLPGADGLDRVWMPPDLVSHPPQHLDEHVVRTISPLALVHVRIASAIAFGGQRPRTWPHKRHYESASSPA